MLDLELVSQVMKDTETDPGHREHGCWEPPCLVSEAVTPMAKAESETWDHKPLRRQSLSPGQEGHLCSLLLHPALPQADDQLANDG